MTQLKSQGGASQEKLAVELSALSNKLKETTKQKEATRYEAQALAQEKQELESQLQEAIAARSGQEKGHLVDLEQVAKLETKLEEDKKKSRDLIKDLKNQYKIQTEDLEQEKAEVINLKQALEEQKAASRDVNAEKIGDLEKLLLQLQEKLKYCTCDSGHHHWDEGKDQKTKDAEAYNAKGYLDFIWPSTQAVQ